MADLWDEFKDLFKTKSQREEEKQQKIKDALESESGLSEKLEALDKAYQDYEKNSTAPEADIDELFPLSPDIKQIEYTPKTDEELRAQAEASLEYDKAADLNKLDKSYSSSQSKIEQSKQSAQSSLEESYKNLEALYKELSEKSKNTALKNGIARGSILSSDLEALENDKDISVGEVQAAYELTIDTLADELNSLNASREKALEELDLKYATELQEKIDKLTKERDNTVLKYEKYNNSVKEKQADYAADRAADVQKYLQKRESDKQKNEAAQKAYEAEYGYSGEKQKNYAARYDLAYDFYTSLSADIAADALEASPSMKYYLGNYYDKLLTILKNSASATKKYY
jgi:DNA repair exonuclease SbcCD ATPase subunit